MSVWAIVGTCVAVYFVLGVVLITCMFYIGWYRGENISWGDLLAAPLVCVVWPVVALDLLSDLWQKMLSEWDRRSRAKGKTPVPFREQVAIPGRLSARVEKALKE